MSTYKQVIIVRKDLNLSKGKMAAQVAHASVEATLKANKNIVSSWRNEGMKKIILKVESKEELYKYLQEAKDDGIATAIISDAGHTEIRPGTVTCLAIGPDTEKHIDLITEKLSSY